MTRAFFLFLLILYYWYFYYDSHSENVPKPSTKLSAAPLYNFTFESKRPDHFEFVVNGISVWDHNLPADTFTFHNDKIVQIDPCHKLPNDALIPATGKILYDYLKLNPDIKKLSKFRANSQYTVQKGTVFYFKCLNGHIDQLQICPSGSTFLTDACQNVNPCTDKPDGTVLPHPEHASKYLYCEGERESVLNCPDKHIFYHNRCESANDLTHYCKLHPEASFLYDEVTRVECENGILNFFRCKPGTMFIGDSTRCEPAICYGKQNGTKLPLPERKTHPFRFVPGYMTCLNDRVDEIVECPQHWDDSLSEGDNLTFLPMAFDGQKCSVPKFCENVFSDDPDIIVPVHEFTKFVKNWDLSKFIDRGVGHACENNVRKRKRLEGGTLISKRFKAEPACVPPMPEKIPMYPSVFYDCASRRTIHCPPFTFFNGSDCVPEPPNAFKFQNWPLFRFDSLNLESWIKAWDYSKSPAPKCRDPESVYVKLYNICSHPDCSDFAFASQIPDMAFLLPPPHRAKCKFYNHVLKKEPVDFEYDFWTQATGNEKPCEPGRNIQTGNFIWDSTVFTTCNPRQPFIFCPSSRRIVPTPSGYHACEPPIETRYPFRSTEWTVFEKNEIKRIFPSGTANVRLNKSAPNIIVPESGLDIAEDARINIFSSDPLEIEPRYRVTHPPNVAFKYGDGTRETLESTPDQGFLVKLQNFTHKSLSFPKYTPVHFVESFKNQLYI